MARSVARTATSLAAIFDIEPSPRSNAIPLAAIHDARQVNSRAASIWRRSRPAEKRYGQVHSAAAALNQPPAHATQTMLFAQFTAISGSSGCVYGGSLSEVVGPQLTVRLGGGDLRSEY